MNKEAELIEAIQQIDGTVKPFREKREAISRQIEELKTHARGLSEQILEIEDQKIPLEVQLQVIRKRAGRLIKPKPL